MNSLFKSLKEEAKNVGSLKFVKSLGQWALVEQNDGILTGKELSFITYNVWFEQHNWNNRLIELGWIFETYLPDFICLQEITGGFLKYIMSLGFIQDNYYMSNNFKGGYDVLILSKYNVPFYTFKYYESNMDRNLLYTELPVLLSTGECEKIIIGTTHLESLDNSLIRIHQLKCCFELFNTSNISFLMGDFNFDPSYNEQSKMDSTYIDTWSVYRDSNGLEEKDGVTMLATKYFPAWRPDRLIYKDISRKIIQYYNFEIIGNKEIEQENNISGILTPSDHFGLYSKFKINHY
jgi:tyrosyl-DNA phosphodiesterase 2